MKLHIIRTRHVLLATALFALGTVLTVTAAGDSGVILFDSFSGKGNQPLAGRVPVTSVAGAVWQIEDGAWSVKGGFALDDTKVKEVYAGDRRAYLETGESNLYVGATLKRGGGREFQGVVGRYAGPTDWIMAFYDGVGDIVLGAKNSSAGGGFIELGRAPVVLRNGSVHEIGLNLDGDIVSAFVDSTQVIPHHPSTVISYSGNMQATRAGIFLRGNGSSRFDEFEVTGPLDAAN